MEFGMAGEIAKNPRGAFGLASSLADLDDPDQGVYGMRIAGDAIDNMVGINKRDSLDGIVGASNNYPSEEVMKIIGLAGDDMERVTGNFLKRADMYRQMSDQDSALLGAVPMNQA